MDLRLTFIHSIAWSLYVLFAAWHSKSAVRNIDDKHAARWWDRFSSVCRSSFEASMQRHPPWTEVVCQQLFKDPACTFKHSISLEWMEQRVGMVHHGWPNSAIIGFETSTSTSWVLLPNCLSKVSCQDSRCTKAARWTMSQLLAPVPFRCMHLY